MSKKTTITNEESVKTEQFETIFTIVDQNGNCRIAVGQHIVSKLTFATVDEAKDYIASKPWELIVNATCAIYDLSKTIKK